MRGASRRGSRLPGGLPGTIKWAIIDEPWYYPQAQFGCLRDGWK